MPTHLERLMSRAIRNPQEESTFFRALMEATVYAHIPLGDRFDAQSDRIRFVQFHRPDTGQVVLPFFTDEAKARLASQSTATVIALRGRLFLELTRGATLMLDPNDCRCTLYPEEVHALLRTGRIATINKFIVEEKTAPRVGASHDDPAWLIDDVTTTLAKLPFVQVAYLAGLYDHSESPEQVGYVVALGGAAEHGERAVHAVITSLQPLCQTHSSLAVDMTHFEMSKIPDWITALALPPFYDRGWGERIHQATGSAGQDPN
jgi:hypothetical protein